MGETTIAMKGGRHAGEKQASLPPPPLIVGYPSLCMGSGARRGGAWPSRHHPFAADLQERQQALSTESQHATRVQGSNSPLVDSCRGE